ncbi:MAG: S8 family peptidase [Brotaphodocola sp.]
MPNCELYPASEEYADFIVRYATWNPQTLIDRARTECINFITSSYAVIHARLDQIAPMSIYRYSYNAIPKLYGLLDTTALESSGIPEVVNHPVLQANGRGVILGIIDTGIDYTNPLFRNPDGSSRILSIWDQSIPYETPLESITGFQPFYGSVYDQETINRALASDDPFQIVPSKDTQGHGTFLAGVAAGNFTERPTEFSGAAPKADLAIVKLKPAKQYLRDFFLIRPDIPAFQENDIMTGISFLLSLATKYFRPLVILIGVGTNQGSHDGSSPLGFQLQGLRGVSGLSVVTGAGNETGYSHHFFGTIDGSQTYQEAELRVGPNDSGFCLEFWASGPELYKIGFISPSGEVIQQIPLALGSEATIPFRLDATTITLNYQLYEAGSGNQLIFMRFQTPAQGIWRIRIYPAAQVSGSFHMWLPMHGFVSDDTIFLRADPDTTITDPGNVPMVLTVSAYDHKTNSIYIHSSRGFSSTGQIKPELAAPGVDVQGPSLTISSTVPAFTRRTGTSVASAFAAGAAADFFTWAIVDQNNETANGAAVKSLLTRGADRNPDFSYPNRQWGYGSLNLYQSFQNL